MFDLDSYLAGVFDGEGWISAQSKSNYRNRKCYTRLLVGLGMNIPEVPQMFADRFGGKVHIYTSGNLIMYQWYQTTASAIPALEVFSEFCVLKREQARHGLELARLLSKIKIGGKRAKGSTVISEQEIDQRQRLTKAITDLKVRRGADV